MRDLKALHNVEMIGGPMDGCGCTVKDITTIVDFVQPKFSERYVRCSCGTRSRRFHYVGRWTSKRCLTPRQGITTERKYAHVKES